MCISDHCCACLQPGLALTSRSLEVGSKGLNPGVKKLAVLAHFGPDFPRVPVVRHQSQKDFISDFIFSVLRCTAQSHRFVESTSSATAYLLDLSSFLPDGRLGQTVVAATCRLVAQWYLLPVANACASLLAVKRSIRICNLLRGRRGSHNSTSRAPSESPLHLILRLGI